MKRVVLFIMMAALSSSAMAWGSLGHRTIAEIAERNLTPEAKANIERYTKGTPLYIILYILPDGKWTAETSVLQKYFFFFVE